MRGERQPGVPRPARAPAAPGTGRVDNPDVSVLRRSAMKSRRLLLLAALTLGAAGLAQPAAAHRPAWGGAGFGPGCCGYVPAAGYGHGGRWSLGLSFSSGPYWGDPYWGRPWGWPYGYGPAYAPRSWQAPPAPVRPAAPPAVAQPRQGQGGAQAEADWQACNRAAVATPAAMADAAAFQATVAACMDARGYTLR